MTRFTPSQRPAHNVTPLRVINQSLAKAADGHLPSVCLSPAFQTEAFCDVLNPTADLGSKSQEGAERASLVHQFKTQLTALSGNKDPQRRFTAIILIKEIVDAVGLKPVQQEIGLWIRNLLTTVKKPKDATSAVLCVITLTRIFQLSHEAPELVREFTTPVLSEYLAAILRLGQTAVRDHQAYTKFSEATQTLSTVFESLLCLVPLHPTQSRPFMSEIQLLIAPFLARNVATQDSDSRFPNASLSQAARQIFVSLHVCTPKGKCAEGWEASLDALLLQLQHTANRVFGSLVNYSAVSLNVHESEIAKKIQPSFLLLKEWSTLSNGLQRLDDLLALLAVYLTSRSFVPVRINLGGIFITLGSLLRVVAPAHDSTYFKAGTCREDRDSLIVKLPTLHHTVIRTLHSIMIVLPSEASAATVQILELMIWVFGNENQHASIRDAYYKFTTQILQEGDATSFTGSLARLAPLYEACCEDVRSSRTDSSSSLKSCIEAADQLLLAILKHHPQELLASNLKSRLLSSAVLTKNGEAILASSLNAEETSVLPFLSRQTPDSSGLNALVRPQFPVLPADPFAIAPHALDGFLDSLPAKERQLEEGSASPLKDFDTSLPDATAPIEDAIMQPLELRTPLERVVEGTESTSQDDSAVRTAKSPSPADGSSTDGSLALELGDDLGIEIPTDSES